jgi:tyrosyl-tRNA synthetase
VPGLTDANSKIDLLDGAPAVKKKIKTAFCEEGNTENNPILAFTKAVLFPISAGRVRLGDDRFWPWVEDGAPEGVVFSVPRRDQETRHYKTFEDMQADFGNKEIHPGDLKAVVTAAITGLMAPILEAYQASEDWREVESKAYPVPVKVVKQKKVHNCLFYLRCGLTVRCCVQDKGKDKSRGKPPAAAANGDTSAPPADTPTRPNV